MKIAALTLTVLFGALVAGGCSGTENARNDASRPKSDQSDSTIHRLAEKLGCDQVVDRTGQFVEWRLAASADCVIDGDVVARLHSARSTSDLEFAVRAFRSRFKGSVPPPGCPNRAEPDPRVVVGDRWLIVAGRPKDVNRFVKQSGGRIDRGTEHGPIVSYLPFPEHCTDTS